MIAVVTLELEVSPEQLERAQARAAELDRHNMGDAAESYTAAQALSRILATDDAVVTALIPAYTGGYTADPDGGWEADTYA